MTYRTRSLESFSYSRFGHQPALVSCTPADIRLLPQARHAQTVTMISSPRVIWPYGQFCPQKNLVFVRFEENDRPVESCRERL